MNLEEVKAKCTGVSIATINLGNEYSLTKEVQWLIQQAERVEHLDKAIREMVKREDDFRFRIINLEKESQDHQYGVEQWKKKIDELTKELHDAHKIIYWSNGN